MTSPYYYADDQVTLHVADCRDVLAALPADSVDSICTDPPYELNFMGKGWDATGIAYDPAMWAACLRVLKPGGHLLSFGGTRTYHRMACAVEDAGFEIRDSIMWIYGSGFPKSLDVSKAIDKAAGATREVVGSKTYADGNGHVEAWPGGENGHEGWQRPGAPVGDDRAGRMVTAPATPEASRWSGWGTALKPAHEPIVVARKPLAGQTVAANVLAHGTGGLNIDGCRVGTEARVNPPRGTAGPGGTSATVAMGGAWRIDAIATEASGRWPANVVLDDTAAAELDKQSGTLTSGNRAAGEHGLMGYMGADVAPMPAIVGDTGGASRFFPVFRYEPKAPTLERPNVNGEAHATVKPLDLIRWLIRLVTPPGGLVLDPFAGSGTTAEAAIIEGFRCTIVELTPAHLPLILARITKPLQPVLDFGAMA